MPTDRTKPKVHIDRHDVANGHVLFRSGTDKFPLEQRPALLEASMLQWLKQNPEFKVRATLPITSYGSCGSDCLIEMIGRRLELNDPAVPCRYPASYPASVDSI